MSSDFDAGFKALLEEAAEQGNHKCLLDQLLAVLHGDGGQYTALAGYSVSVLDAINQFHADRTELRELRRLKHKASSSSSSASACSPSSLPGSGRKKRNG